MQFGAQAVPEPSGMVFGLIVLAGMTFQTMAAASLVSIKNGMLI
ncbi:MAG: hypothetical protein R3C03_11500 [Pirellulaceae bacterium]